MKEYSEDQHMQKAASDNQTKRVYVLSFLIPIVMMTIISLVLEMYPFGERTILISDMNKQFNDYFAYFKTIVSGENNLVYTFSKNLGGDMVGFSAYYLQNPFLLLLLLFPNEILPVGIWVMITLQIAFCSLSFSYYLVKTNQTSIHFFGILLFSLAYGFMGYIFAYITLPIYFCCIIMLPLVILGIHKIINDEKDRWFYIITLAVSVLFNYYIGYMICIYSALFFMYLLLKKVKNLRQIKEYGKTIVSFILSSIAGVLLTAFDIIPVFFSLRGQKEMPAGSVLEPYRNFRMLDAFSKLYSNMYDGNTSNHNLPFIYVGFITIFFIVVFFISHEVTKKEKIITLGFLCTMLLCFYIHTLDVIWHGMNEPVGFPYRYAFLFSFILLHIAYRGFVIFVHQVKIKQAVIFAVVFIIYTIYLIISNLDALVIRSIMVDLTLLIVLLLCVWGIVYHKWSHTIVMYLLLLLQVIDLSSNAITSVKQYTDYVPMNQYKEYISQVSPIVDYIKKKDTSLYRMEKNFQRSHNDSMQFNYKGLSHSSSCEKDYVKEFMGKLGFRNFGLWAYYDEGGTAFADCFLGVKYYISKYDATGKPYNCIYDENQKYVFENPYAFPFAFGIQDKAFQVDMNQRDPFMLQNEMASSFTDGDKPIYTNVSVDKVNVVNLDTVKEGEFDTYRKQQAERESYIEYVLNIDNQQPVYFFFDAPNQQSATVMVNDLSYGNYFSDTKWDIVEIGSFKKGDKVSLKLYVTSNELSLKQTYLYYEDKDAIIQMHQQASTAFADIEQVSNSHLYGTIAASDNSYLGFSIPYEDGWKIKVDGKIVEKKELFSALMAVPISKGEHTFEMIYIPQGFIVGVIISTITLILCVVIYVVNIQKRKSVEEMRN